MQSGFGPLENLVWDLRGHVFRGSRRRQRSEEAMNTEYIVTGVIALLLLGYLVFALLKPEKF